MKNYACNSLEEKPLGCPRKTQVLLGLELLQNFSLFDINGEEVQVECLKIVRKKDKQFTRK